MRTGEHDHHGIAGILATRDNGACLRCNIGWIRVFDELGLEGGGRLTRYQKLVAADLLAAKYALRRP